MHAVFSGNTVHLINGEREAALGSAVGCRIGSRRVRTECSKQDTIRCDQQADFSTGEFNDSGFSSLRKIDSLASDPSRTFPESQPHIAFPFPEFDMAYPASNPNCYALQVCPVRLPNQAPQTPMWMAMWPCLHPANRADRVDVCNIGMPHPPAPLNQNKMQARAAPQLRARQEEGNLPPACRGAACTAEQFVSSITRRFQVHHSGIPEGEALMGKHVLVLLPEHDTQAVASVDWLLDQHADFAGVGGQVIMNDKARAWLAQSRGAGSINAVRARSAYKALDDAKELEAALADLIQRKNLGAPPAFKGATEDQIRQQFSTWHANAQGEKLRHLLQKQEKGLLDYLRLAAELSPQAQILRDSKADGLTVSVLAGADASRMLEGGLKFPGLVVSPAAEWSAHALTATLRHQGISIGLRDAKFNPIPDMQSLKGKLLVAGVGGADQDEAAALASRLLAVLQQHTSGKVPVTVLTLADSIAVQRPDVKLLVLDDPKLQDMHRADQALAKKEGELLALIAAHSPQEPLASGLASRLGREAFLATAGARVKGFATKEARDAGHRLLGEYELAEQTRTRVQLERWKAVFASAAEAHAQSQSQSDKMVCLMLLGQEPGPTMDSILLAAPGLDKLFGQTLLTKVEAVNYAQPLM